MTHLNVHLESTWAEHLANENSPSLTLVGEPNSGLSLIGESILRAALARLGAQAPVVMRLNAQGLPAPQDDGPEAKRVCSLRCLQVIMDLAVDHAESTSSPSSEPGKFADDATMRLTLLLSELRRGDRPPLIRIDHFECLASRFDRAAWEVLRSLVDRRAVQLLLFSRFLLSELDPLTGSRLFGVIPHSVQVGTVGQAERGLQARAALLECGVSAPPDVIEYVATLGGGSVGLMRGLGRMIAHHSIRLPRTSRATVDTALGDDHESLRQQLCSVARWLHPEHEPDGLLARELEREIAAVFELLFAPAGLVAGLDQHIQRLKRLGHIETGETTAFRFSTPLVRSLSMLRWHELLRSGAAVDPKYAVWWELDEALRGWIRAHESAGRIVELVESAGFPMAQESFRATQTWWGSQAAVDSLDELTAEGLLAVLQQAGFARAWVSLHREQLDAIGRSRPTLLRTTVVSPWSAARRCHEEERVRAVLSQIPRPARQATAAPRETRRVVRWLHISDIHLGRELKAGEDFVLRSFLNELRRDAGRNPDARLGPRPDLVFFTGDLANQGRSEEYARAAPLLDELLGILSLGRRQLFLVPGNHDVYRPYTKYLQRDYQNDDSIHEVIRDKRWQRLYRERLGGFDEFVRSYFAEVPERLEVTELGFPAPQVVEVAGNSLLIHLLDPLLGSAGDDDKGKLLLGLIARRAEFVDCPQAALRLALMHHPPDWLCVPDADHFAKHVGEHIDLLLGGHVHKGEFKRTISTRGSMCELRAGALFQGHDYENTAQFAEFDFDTRELLVFPVEYKRDRDRWVRDARFGEHPAYTHREVLPARE